MARFFRMKNGNLVTDHDLKRTFSVISDRDETYAEFFARELEHHIECDVMPSADITVELAEKGELANATLMWRELTGCRLMEAKEYVNNIYRRALDRRAPKSPRNGDS